MKSLERNFVKIIDKNPHWSTYTCFAEAVKGKNFGKETIRRWFNKLVDKDDYHPSEKKAILFFLLEISSATKK